MSKIPVRLIAEIAGVAAIAVSAAMWHAQLGPLVVGVYLIVWAGRQTGGE